jgi:hypothetical protein
MVRFNYTQFAEEYRPPAPLIPVHVSNPLTSSEPIQWVAQLDPGADRTVFPEQLLELLSAQVFDATVVEGFGGGRYRVPTYVVKIQIPTFRTHVVEVTEGRGEEFVLLGRDVLNKYRLTLNGPQLQLDIE